MSAYFSKLGEMKEWEKELQGLLDLIFMAGVNHRYGVENKDLIETQKQVKVKERIERVIHEAIKSEEWPNGEVG